MKKSEISEFIKQARQGSQSAYNVLLNLYWGDVYRFLHAKCKNDFIAEDITINSFSKAFEKLAMYDEKYDFKSWILTIANNLYIDYLRAQNKEIESVRLEGRVLEGSSELVSSPEDKLIQKQHLDELLSYIKQLKPHYREMIVLRYFQEYSYKEIAEETGENLSSVKVRLMRAKKLLSELILKGKKN